MLSEKHHASIVCSFYKELKSNLGDKGITIFIKATQTYGEQRGKRMSLRALKDGYKLSYPVYFAYSEWEATPGGFDINEKVEHSTVWTRCYKCPWNTVFKEKEALECGVCYCMEIDRAIVRGFNPDLEFETKGTLHNGDFCSLHFTDKSVDEMFFEKTEKIVQAGGNANIKSFDYHCAHLFNTFVKTLLNAEIDQDKAKKIIENVINTFKSDYNKKLLMEILKYEEEDFSYLPKL